MKYLFLLFFLRLKATLRAPIFWGSAVFFLALVLTFGAILPRQEQTGLCIGITAHGAVAREAAAILERNGDYQTVIYSDTDAMTTDILRGKLHCGYLLDDTRAAGKTPMTVFAPTGAYMRPLLDQLVFAAYFEAGVPQITDDFLAALGMETQALPEIFERVQQDAVPMEIQLIPLGGASVPLPENETSSVLPMLYAVLVSLFLAVCLLAVLLQPPAEERALAHLFAVRPVSTVCASVGAALLTQFALLLAADWLLGLLLGAQNDSLSARLGVFLWLAALAALISVPAAAFLRRWQNVVCVLLPLWLVVSVLCSGALISPAKLPGVASWLRFLSPAWYALRALGKV